MYIPKTMKKAIDKIFYDKFLEILEENTTKDNEGSIIVIDYKAIDNFRGNVNFNNCKKIQEEYGLKYEIDITITTNYQKLKINDFIKYKDITYNVTDVLESDSHFLILAKKCPQ